jgi:hypothetical protein
MCKPVPVPRTQPRMAQSEPSIIIKDLEKYFVGESLDRYVSDNPTCFTYKSATFLVQRAASLTCYIPPSTSVHTGPCDSTRSGLRICVVPRTSEGSSVGDWRTLINTCGMIALATVMIMRGENRRWLVIRTRRQVYGEKLCQTSCQLGSTSATEADEGCGRTSKSSMEKGMKIERAGIDIMLGLWCMAGPRVSCQSSA